MLAPGTFQGLGCHVESFFTKTHREVRPALCGVGSRHVNYEFHELSSKRFRSYDCFNGPENLQNVFVFSFDTFFKTSDKMGRFCWPKWHMTWGCSCCSSWQILVTILWCVVQWAPASCNLEPTTPRIRSTRMLMVHGFYQSLWISKILAPFLDCGAFLWGYGQGATKEMGPQKATTM